MLQVTRRRNALLNMSSPVVLWLLIVATSLLFLTALVTIQSPHVIGIMTTITTVKNEAIKKVLQLPALKNTKYEEAYNMPDTAADDPRVIEVLRKSYLLPPSSAPYNLVHNSSHDPSIGQSKVVDKLLQGKTGGFFVECGGFDGESYSNTLMFERDKGWTGVMVEPDSDNFARMKEKNRKVYIAHSCLAETPHPKKIVFEKNYYAGHIMDADGLERSLGEGEVNVEAVQCFPLYSFLVALNTTRVDYFSLDVEGSEYDVLRNIPWDKVDISVLSVEYHSKWTTYDLILDLMAAQGYEMYTKITHYTGFADDFIFVKKDILKELNSTTFV